jgi:NAD(P)H-quinone oxidoreductase subunit 4
MITEFPWLSAIVLFPLLAALPIPLLPDDQGKTVRWYALGVALSELAFILYSFWQNYNLHIPGYQMMESYAWVPQIGLTWSLAVDGISMPLVILSGLVTTLAILAAWEISHKPRLFYFLILVMYSAQIGVFVAQDLLMFFVMWELELVPVYLLIAIWGGAKRQYAATKFILYTAAGSLFILLAAFAMAAYGNTFTFNMQELSLKDYSLSFELAIYAALLVAFGVKLPIFPFHTWLPDAHGEAPAPVSMILAGDGRLRANPHEYGDAARCPCLLRADPGGAGCCQHHLCFADCLCTDQSEAPDGLFFDRPYGFRSYRHCLIHDAGH